VFYPEGADTLEQVRDRLVDADQNGWHLDEGPRLRADGSQFWASAIISPLPDRDPLVDQPESPAYCMVMRDISDKREATDNPERDA
jgi:hypothetical protein